MGTLVLQWENRIVRSRYHNLSRNERDSGANRLYDSYMVLPCLQSACCTPTLLPPLQVLTFREDARLWSLDKWLMTEVSYHYESFAEVYLNELMHSPNGLIEVTRKKLDGRYKTSADLRGLRLRTEYIQDRLDIFASRSERLEGLVLRNKSLERWLRLGK